MLIWRANQSSCLSTCFHQQQQQTQTVWCLNERRLNEANDSCNSSPLTRSTTTNYKHAAPTNTLLMSFSHKVSVKLKFVVEKRLFPVMTEQTWYLKYPQHPSPSGAVTPFQTLVDEFHSVQISDHPGVLSPESSASPLKYSAAKSPTWPASFRGRMEWDDSMKDSLKDSLPFKCTFPRRLQATEPNHQKHPITRAKVIFATGDRVPPKVKPRAPVDAERPSSIF